LRNDALDDALDEHAAARAELDPPRANSSLAPLIPPLLRFYHSEHTATETAHAAIQDQVLSQDLQAGGGRRMSPSSPRTASVMAAAREESALLLPWVSAGSTSAH
jgi:hypothetical protein